MNRNSPKANEVEVSLIGTGGGYGESVVVKIGVDSWIIIDSCIDPNSNTPLALVYLHELGITLDKVKLVICTHWHRDHIRGLSDVLKACEKAEFCFSEAGDLKKFLYLCELDFEKWKKGGVESTAEFRKCIEIIAGRNTMYSRASSDKLLFRLVEGEIAFELFALSPSPSIVQMSDEEISELISEFGKRNTAIIKKSPNDKCVALLLKFNSHRIILGADLEVGKSENEGWRFVASNCKIIEKDVKASLYKVPHHGSETSYLKHIFEDLVETKSVLHLAPYRTQGLPKNEMLDIYANHSGTVFITSKVSSSLKPKKRDKRITKMIERTVRKIREVKFTKGIIQSRINTESKEADWTTVLIDAASKHP